MHERQNSDLTVLVVEDYEDTSLAMRLALEEEGYHIHEAANGRQAVEMAKRVRPDVILMDLQLPELDGFTATKLIRKNDELKETIIVAVTAHREPDYRARALTAGCNAYVTKPIDFDWLNSLIHNLLP